MKEAELFATLALINHLDSTKFYNFAVSEITVNRTYLSDHEDILGIGITPRHNLINHSCDPNINSFNRKREHVIFSVREIKQGQQVSIAHIRNHKFEVQPEFSRMK